MREEGGIVCDGRPSLYGLYRNGPRDHVACYVVRRFRREGLEKEAVMREIAEAAFFPVDALPPETTAATRARLKEVLGSQASGAEW